MTCTVQQFLTCAAKRLRSEFDPGPYDAFGLKQQPKRLPSREIRLRARVSARKLRANARRRLH